MCDSRSKNVFLNAICAGIAVLTIGIAAHQARAHGEDKPGPNGGEIRMPGAFHTEVVKKTEGEVSIFLLDIEFKNPMTENSNVRAKLRQSGKTVDLACKVTAPAFSCRVPKGARLEKGELIVIANRSGQQANEAVYKLPLGNQKAGHGGD